MPDFKWFAQMEPIWNCVFHRIIPSDCQWIWRDSSVSLFFRWSEKNMAHFLFLCSKLFICDFWKYISVLWHHYLKVMYKIGLIIHVCICLAEMFASICQLFQAGIIYSQNNLRRKTILTLKAMKYFYINNGDQRVFSIWNHHKCLSSSILLFYFFTARSD